MLRRCDYAIPLTAHTLTRPFSSVKQFVCAVTQFSWFNTFISFPREYPRKNSITLAPTKMRWHVTKQKLLYESDFLRWNIFNGLSRYLTIPNRYDELRIKLQPHIIIT